MKTPYDRLFHRWLERSGAKAMADPEYAAIQERRGPDGLLFLSQDLSWEDFEKQQEIRDRLSPQPRYLRFLGAIEHYRRYDWFPSNWRRAAQTFWQRGRRGWADRDVWSLDYHLASVIETSVLRLRDTDHGWPGDPMTPEEWHGILTEIAEGFAAARQEGDSAEEDQILQQKFERGADLFKEWFHHLWD